MKASRASNPEKRPDPPTWLRRWGLPAVILLLAGFSVLQLLTRPPIATEDAPPAPTATPAVPATPPPTGAPMTETDYVWEARADGTAVLLAYTGSADTVLLPEAFGGLPLRRVGDGAFRDCGTVVSVTVPEGVTSLGDYAFYGCGRLTRLVLPGGPLEIGVWAIQPRTTVVCPEGSDAARWCDRRRIPRSDP